MKELLKAKSEFRKKGVVLKADKMKSGGGGSWKFAGEDNLIRTIQEPLSSCGLELITSMEYLRDANKNTIKVTLFHVASGENISSQISIPDVIPKMDKNNNPMWLDAEIERGKQFGYWSRILSIRILGLSDIDPEDTMNVPVDISDEGAKEALQALESTLDKMNDRDDAIKFIKGRFEVDDYKKLSVAQMKQGNTVLLGSLNANN